MVVPNQEQYDLQAEACAQQHDHSGLARTLELIGDKWTIALIHHLFQGKNRFGQLLKAMEGISPKTLSVRLKKLEQQGLITRQIFPEVPLHIEYFVTKKGRSLHKVIQVLDEWGNQWEKSL
jgi:DNA-binding HxlR family transcriptional regulator